MQHKPRILRIVIDEDDAGRIDRDLVSDVVADAIDMILAGRIDRLELSTSGKKEVSQ